MKTVWPVLGAWLLLAAVTVGYTALCCAVLRLVGVVWLPWWLGLAPLVVVLAMGVIGWTAGEGSAIPVEATIADAADEPRLHAVVDRACALSGQDKPTLWILETDIPNALVRVPNDLPPQLYVSRGLLERLDNPQLEAVAAHELAHIAHRDTRVMGIAQAVALAFPGLGAILLGFFSIGVFYLEVPACALARLCGRPWSAVAEEREEKEDTPAPRRRVPRVLVPPLLVLAGLLRGAVWTIVITTMMTLGLGVIWMMVPGYAAAGRLARRRELAADRAAAEVTGAPSVLAAALGAIEGGMHRAPAEDLRLMADALPQAIVAFEVPASPDADSHDRWMAWANRTHPPMGKRMVQLQQMSRSMARP